MREISLSVCLLYVMVLIISCCLLEFRCLQKTSDNLCGEISKEPD